jgi:hypothetical protein
MNQSESIDKLLPALLAARRAIAPAKKGGHNDFDKYAYATHEDWHAAVMPRLLKNGLLLSVSTVSVENLPDRTTKKGGTEYPVQVLCAARLWHESGQWIEVQGPGQGQDRADKGIYKALTGAAKYLYAQLFALPTTDDPEADTSVGQGEGPKASTPDKPTADVGEYL